MANIYSYSLMEFNADFSYFSDQNYARILEEFGVHLLFRPKQLKTTSSAHQNLEFRPEKADEQRILQWKRSWVKIEPNES